MLLKYCYNTASSSRPCNAVAIASCPCNYLIVRSHVSLDLVYLSSSTYSIFSIFCLHPIFTSLMSLNLQQYLVHLACCLHVSPQPVNTAKIRMHACMPWIAFTAISKGVFNPFHREYVRRPSLITVVHHKINKYSNNINFVVAYNSYIILSFMTPIGTIITELSY